MTYETHSDEALRAMRLEQEARDAKSKQGGKTGWPAGMLQDDSRELSKALASKPDARECVRSACAEILAAQPVAPAPTPTNGIHGRGDEPGAGSSWYLKAVAALSKEAQPAAQVVDEASQLLYIAYTAMCKMRLRGKGSDVGLSHEVRMFALEFSDDARDGPGELQVTGTGRYRKWRDAAHEAYKARAALAGKVAP